MEFPKCFIDVASLSIILVLIYTLWFVRKQIEFRIWKIPPGPIGIPFLGHIIMKKYLCKHMAQLNKTYGNVCSIDMLSIKMIMVSDYDTAKELLSHPSTFGRPRYIFDILPGNAGFATMEGEEWSKERKRFMTALKNVGFGKETWDDIILDEVKKSSDYIAAAKGRPIDAHEQLSLSAMCSMFALFMGRRSFNALPKEEVMLTFEGLIAFKKTFENMDIILAAPWLARFLTNFNIAGYGYREKAIKAACDVVKKIVVERLNTEHEDDPTDFIKHYANRKEQNSRKTSGDVCVDLLIGNMITFLETSDTAMTVTSWLIFIMASYPKIQANVHREIDDVIGRNRTVTWEDRKKLPYTMACICEAMRWIAITPVFIPRSVSETFEFHGYSIPKGSLILTNGWALNRDAKYWDRPEEYMPERFLHLSVEKYSTAKGYAPFSFGKRNCPADRISMMIVYLYFTRIMQQFKIRTPSGKSPDLTPQFGFIHEPNYQDVCFIDRE